ncbi:F-box domain protein [Cooperia oncophora]
MDTLNRDCLSQIFLNLDFIERVRLEHVCRMFHYVLQQQSTFSDSVNLDISQFLISTSTDYYQQDSLSFLPTVVGVIERCGLYVQHLTFGQRWLRISQPIIDCIANNCIRLSVVDLGAVILNADLSPLLEKIAPQLQEFSLEETSWVNIECAEKVQNYFESMKKLRKLNLRSAMFQVTRLAELPTTLRYLEIGGAHSFPPENMLEFLQSHDQLEEFYASPVPVLDEEIIAAIGSLNNLRHLSLGHSYNTDLHFDELGNLTKLESLRLNDVFGLTETSLQQILSRLQNLERLALVNCKNVFDYTALGSCGRLQSLEIRNTMQLANEDILALCSHGNLQTTRAFKLFQPFISWSEHCTDAMSVERVNKCARVTDEMMYTLASTQRELEYISIQECLSITR